MSPVSRPLWTRLLAAALGVVMALQPALAQTPTPYRYVHPVPGFVGPVAIGPLVGSGGGAPDLDVEPASLRFSGTPGASQTVRVTNIGFVAVGPLTLRLAGMDPGAFTVSGCDQALAVQAFCTLSVTAVPSDAYTAASAMLYVGYSGRERGVALAYDAVPSPLVLTPATLNLGSADFGSSSPVGTVTLTNSAATPVVVTGISVTSGQSDFGQSNNCATVPAGGSCLIQVLMTPSAVGTLLGQITVVSAVGTPQLALTGTGLAVAPRAALTDAGAATTDGGGNVRYGVNFAGVLVGTSSAVRTLTLQNAGTSPLAVSGISMVTGQSDFGQSNNCGAAIAAGASCSLDVLFTPSALGARSAVVAVVTDANTFYVDLSGAGTAPAFAVSPAGYFGNVDLAATPTLLVTVSNLGTGPGEVPQPIAVTAGADKFAIVANDCPVTLPAAGTCAVQVRFTPAGLGAFTGTLTVGDPRYGIASALTGTGVVGTQLTVSPTAVSYGAMTAGVEVSSVRVVNISNTGTVPVILGVPTLAGENPGEFELPATNCAGALAPSASCYINVLFRPTAVGLHSALLSVSTDAPSGAVTVPLNGTGGDPHLVWSSDAGAVTALDTDFGTVEAGSTTTRTVYLRNVGSYGTAAASVALSGDTGQISLVSVGEATDTGTVVPCLNGGEVSGTSSSVCHARGGSLPHLAVQLRYTANVPGSHSVTVSLATDNGTVLPDAATFTGTTPGALGQWSSQQGSTVAFAANTADAGPSPVGAPLVQAVYLRNVGVFALAAGYAITGDSAFKLLSVVTVPDAGATTACVSGGVVAVDGRSSTECAAQSASIADSARHLVAFVQFTPTATGVATATLTATSGGSVVPAALTLTGTGTPAGGGAVESFSAGAYTSRRWTDGTFAPSCLAYRTPPGGYVYAGDTGDGVYRIQPAGQSATDVYCDMAGGGWTLALALNASSRFYTSNQDPNVGAMGNAPVLPADAASKLSDAFWAAIPGTATEFRLSDGKVFQVQFATSVWATGYHWGRNGNNPRPTCRVFDGASWSAWTLGRTYHAADCYNLSGSPIGVQTNGVLGGGNGGGKAVTAWVK